MDPFLSDLRAIIDPSRVFSSDDKNAEDVIATYSKDHSEHASTAHNPDVVVKPNSTKEVSEIVKLCDKHNIIFTPCGAMTGLEGGAVCFQGGCAISFENMNKVIELIEDDLFVVVQPGILKTELSEWLLPKGLMFYPDPASNPSVGGQASTGASGTTTVKYGTFKENVVSLTVVLPDGEIIDTRRRTRKSSTGYDLTHLILGSEGTLGVITELVLRVGPVIKGVAAARVVFSEVVEAANTVVELRRLGINELARCELLNVAAINAVNKYSGTSYMAAPTLFLEFHGRDDDSVLSVMESVKQIAEKNGGSEFQHTTSESEREILWDARRNAHHAAREYRPYEDGQSAVVYSTDACIPLKHLPFVMEETEKDFSKTDVPPVIVGHVADGNFHVLAPCFERDVSTIQELQKAMAHRALACGGTVSGEHGVSVGKRIFMVEEHGERAIAIMKQIKDLFDPKHLMNPGKVLP